MPPLVGASLAFPASELFDGPSTSASRAAAEKHERAVQFFKRR